MHAFKTAKAAKSCNTFPDVWAAIVGCTGSGNSWRYTVGHFGRRDVEFACPTCRAAQERLDALVGPAHIAELERLQAAAGVADYRLAEVVRKGGRPVLTGKINAGAAREAADHAIRGWLEGGSVERAAKAILVYGGDCSDLVRPFASAAQIRELRTAYLALKASAA